MSQAAKSDGNEDCINLVLPYPPTANNYWRHVGNRVHRTHEAVKFIKQVAKLCEDARVVQLEGTVKVTVEVYRPAKRGDLDNTLKVLLDSLRGYAFKDDSQVVEIHALRFEGKADPCAVVTVERWAL